ncbi:serine/threonine-protein phosphatase [Actinoplanes bogorensis]|uniref:Serine/threonine-protein phosphatase n=1 Tax=Paractinoplanes bogorensis TaxID=1610840 RepID=A0ABS5Z5P1_9ACTN|nr:PP2C family protein-serine/threonine phosphatase [Actinoplanes bogorensis]MBU2671007.1 serine/threonine-protein phosphatase [Actinoplanes bogorensis]
MTAQSPAVAGERLIDGPAPALLRATLLRAALDAASEAVLLCDAADDTILMVNAAAQQLVPGLTTGVTAVDGPLPGLAGALAAGDDSFTDVYADRHLHGRRRALGDDHYGWYLRDRTDEVNRADALRAERARTAFLAEAGRRLSSTLHQGRCQRITAELAVAHLADAAVVVLPVNRRQSQWVRLVAGGTIEEGTLREKVLGEVPGLVEALGGFPPIPSKWLDASQAPDWLLPGEFGALLVTPLPGNAEPAGALILARRGAGAEFGPEDEILARIFAARAGAAISAAGLYREQVDTTAVLQADLLPPDLIQPDGFELIGSYQAAREALRIGGDFYDVFGPTDSSDDTVIALGDVCGKGPEAAVLTGKVRQTLRALRLVDAAPDEMLHVLNKALLESGRQHRFVTMVVGSVSRVEHGRVRLTLATGGHPPPLVLRGDGRVEEVPTSGTLIGAVPRTVVNPAQVELAPGELCLLYSDGLTEARGGPTGDEQFGEARLRDALAECQGLPGVATVERVRQLVSDWVHGGTRDDIAMLAVRAPARAQLSLYSNASPFAIDERRVRARS